MTAPKDKTFIRITNKDIFEQLEGISRALYKINGKVQWHGRAIGLIMVLLGILITSMIAG